MSKSLEEVLVGIPSLSPHTGMKITEIMRMLQVAISEEKDLEIRAELSDYYNALNTVAMYTARHQASAIGMLGDLIKGKGK